MYNVADLREFLFTKCFDESDHKMDRLIFDFGDNSIETLEKDAQKQFIEEGEWKAFAFGGWCARVNIMEEKIDDIMRLKHYFNIYEKLSVSEGNTEGITTLNKECNTILSKFIGKQKKSSLKYRGVSFYSCCPKNRINISEGEVMRMSEFCEKVFTKKWFSDAKWILESGKHSDRPNLHFHALVRFKDDSASKNFKSRCLTKIWNNMYPDNPLDWKNQNNRGIDVKKCNTLQIQKDKYNYMENDSKGSHENFTDLAIGNEFGDILCELN